MHQFKKIIKNNNTLRLINLNYLILIDIFLLSNYKIQLNIILYLKCLMTKNYL